MTTEMMEFHANNSPWTEMYDLHCQREDVANAQDMSSMAEQKAEQDPTHDALADVYNRDETVKQSKRF
ncbi:MAG: hypothetical protein AAF846_10085 [Chloroflexota bacterium]